MTIQKISSGISFVDKLFGGLYEGRPTLLYGPAKSGKAKAAIQYTAAALRAGERVVFFTAVPPDDLLLSARGVGCDFSDAVSSGQLALIPYEEKFIERASHPTALLPMPSALDELAALVRSRKASRVVFNTVLPWVVAESEEAMPDQVRAFIGKLRELGVSSLLLLPMPVSHAAKLLCDQLSENCPIVASIRWTHDNECTFQVHRYSGSDQVRIPCQFSLELVPGAGFLPVRPAAPKEENPTPDWTESAAPRKPVRFSVPGFQEPASPPQSAASSAPKASQPPLTASSGPVSASHIPDAEHLKKKSTIRFSSIIK